MNTQHSHKRFAFYGRTRTPMPARSTEAIQERARQLSIATDLVDSAKGRIALIFFDTRSHPLDALRHRKQARRLLNALDNPDRKFDAVVVGDTRITMSARQFDELHQLCSFHNVEL